MRALMLSLVVVTGFWGMGQAAAADESPCPASASWFTDPSFPTEVPNGSNASNCNFHQFAWQGFIDLVQPAGNGVRTFETWMPDYGVFVPAGTAVTPWGQQPAAPCTPAAGAKAPRKVFLRPRTPKGSGFDPNSDLQATHDPLYDQNKQVVYYSIWMNKVEYDFITQCDFNNTSCITSAPATSAITAGAVELKGAWRVFTSDAPTDMYTIDGVVGDTCKPVTLGLVGFHLVANTPEHPEFIWATFEHYRNAPDCTNPQPTPPGGWSFNNPDCPSGEARCKPNQPKVNPTQVCRVAPQGGGDAQNITNIKALNDSVHSTLTKLLASDASKYAPMKVWLNYSMTGNLWTLNGQLPPSSTNEKGSLLDANTTLETFIQGQSGSGVNQNCFTCHTQQQFVDSKGVAKGFPNGAPANFSHLWGFAQQTGGCGDGKGSLPASCPLTTQKQTGLTGKTRPAGQ
ncbi:hypothetical protein [Tahibacter amnicola]|uniref:Cytochrome c family protein n=1 Tax=Tahibacter amnicola TaxID=2976241 RepID=A0ABY6BIZ2_9GAMM|nr:hypothetical protein [Tahibacter amnicola]UXI69978.1 hypothetical protein N4264_10225 [Tahibacter amnicola]